MGNIGRRISQAEVKLTTLQQESNEDIGEAIAALQTTKADAEREKEGLLAQFHAVATSKSEVDAAQKEFQRESDTIKHELDLLSAKRNELTVRIHFSLLQPLLVHVSAGYHFG